MSKGQKRQKVAKKPASKPKLEIIELEGVLICNECDDWLYKSIDVKMAVCDSCNRIGCEHFVSNDYGTGHCIGKFGCAKASEKGKGYNMGVLA